MQRNTKKHPPSISSYIAQKAKYAVQYSFKGAMFGAVSGATPLALFSSLPTSKFYETINPPGVIQIFDGDELKKNLTFASYTFLPMVIGALSGAVEGAIYGLFFKEITPPNLSYQPPSACQAITTIAKGIGAGVAVLIPITMICYHMPERF